MKLIFKIYKKVRELKREERRLIRDLKLGRELFRHERHCESKKAKDYFKEMKNELESREESLNKREEELNNLQDKINNQILRIASIQGFNNEINI
jgi:Mg2+ and Co2+ transporter CorA